MSKRRSFYWDSAWSCLLMKIGGRWYSRFNGKWNRNVAPMPGHAAKRVKKPKKIL